jgi:hypothetical protein
MDPLLRAATLAPDNHHLQVLEAHTLVLLRHPQAVHTLHHLVSLTH